jgi:hypothetical protein
MRKNYRIRPRAGSDTSGKMHDLSQIARLAAKKGRRTMTESVGQSGRTVPADRHSPGSVTVMEAD